MAISPVASNISFGSQKVSYNLSNMSRQDCVELSKDAHDAFRARKANVSVPAYKAVSPAGDPNTYLKYEIKGDPADPVKNPIEEKHLGKLLGNLYLLDKAGIYHNDLDTNHVFFSEDGKVEIDCFKYAFDFQNSPRRGFDLRDERVQRPRFMMPSNEDGFEYANLGEYFTKLQSYEKDDFVKSYLKVKSEYHGERAKLLVAKGFDPNSDTVRYETAQEKVFKDPSDRVVLYTRDKLELNGQRHKAFTMWNEGNGASGHPVDPMKRFEAIPEYVKAFEKAANLRDFAYALEVTAKNEDEEEYFSLEREYGKYWAENLHNDIKTFGDRNFTDSKEQGGHDIFIGCKMDKDFFDELHGKIKPQKSVDENRKALDNIVKFYKNLAKDWIPERNEIYKREYYKAN